jgi:hypothetical protein
VAAGLDVVVVVVSVEVVPLGLAAGVTVSVFCSQAASNAAPARMQMYFFIVLVETPILGYYLNRSKTPFRPSMGLQPDWISSDGRVVFEAMGLGYGGAG